MTSRRKKSVADSQETTLAYSTGGLPNRAPAPAQPLDPAASRVRLRLDRRASDRLVTVITGIEGGIDTLVQLGRALKAACGAGGTVKDGVIEIQGDHRDPVERELSSRGYKVKRSGG